MSSPNSRPPLVNDDAEAERITSWIAGHFRELELAREQLQQERDAAVLEATDAVGTVGELKTLVRDLCRKMTLLKKEKAAAQHDLAVARQSEMRHHAHDMAVAARKKSHHGHAHGGGKSGDAKVSMGPDPLAQLQKRNTMLSTRAEEHAHRVRELEAKLRQERSAASKRRIAAEADADDRIGAAEAAAAVAHTRVEEREVELAKEKAEIDELHAQIIALTNDHTSKLTDAHKAREKAEGAHAELMHRFSSSSTATDAAQSVSTTYVSQVADLTRRAETATAQKTELAKRYYALEARLVEQAKVLHTERTAFNALKAKYKEDVRKQRLEHISRVDRKLKLEEAADAADARDAARSKGRSRKSASAYGGGKKKSARSRSARQ